MPTPFLFCFGLGYSALALAKELQAEGWRIAGTCREEARRAVLGGLGIETWIFDRERSLLGAERALGACTHVLSSVPPDGLGDPVIDGAGVALAGRRDLHWVGYLSTTGVYGNRDGAWVDEESALLPTGERGQRRIAAEDAWRRLWQEAGLPVHIFRLAGIYGPGRSAFDTLRAGRAHRIDKPGQVFSRIHVADIVQALRASMSRPRGGAIYNLCDDDPAPPAEVIAYAAGLLGVDPPPLVSLEAAGLSDRARSFYEDSKRVRNDRIKQELGLTLAYPDYRAGLAAILKGEGGR
jgi:nucleoside-diphosphate-sugar epimerase